MMSPYGTPYAAVYPHGGGVSAHPGFPMVNNSKQSQEITASSSKGPTSNNCKRDSQFSFHRGLFNGFPHTVIWGLCQWQPGTPLNMDTPTKSTGNTDNGLMKKLKEFDGLAMSLGTAADERKRSWNSSETEGSTNGSDVNTTGVMSLVVPFVFICIVWTEADEPKLKRNREGTPTKDEKRYLVLSCSFRSVSPSSGDDGVKPVQRAIVSPGVSANSNSFMSQSLAMVQPETWLQVPHNERELKRERRKQSNRESAKRSRLRKQVLSRFLFSWCDTQPKRLKGLMKLSFFLPLFQKAETEELARKVEALTAENMALRSELNQLNEKSDKLRGANAALLNNLKSSEPEKSVFGNKNSGSGCNESNSSSKLHQLLDTKPRADAVAAG
ncbi:hypothetical protein YC2023_036944 [Brassica napus]